MKAQGKSFNLYNEMNTEKCSQNQKRLNEKEKYGIMNKRNT